MAMSPVRFTAEKLDWMLAEAPDGWTESYRDELQRCLATLKNHVDTLDQANPLPETVWQEVHDLVKLQGRIILRLKQVHRLIDGEWRVLSL